MIIIPGSNPMGNVLHIILGQESELIADIHGATIMDITPAINKFTVEKPIFVSISRCKSETDTVKGLVGSKIDHLSSFGLIAKPDGSPGCDNCGSCGTIGDKGKEKANEQAVEKMTVTLKDGVCTYCGHKSKLLPIPGFKTCLTCAQIELGRRVEQKKASEDEHKV